MEKTNMEKINFLISKLSLDTDAETILDCFAEFDEIQKSKQVKCEWIMQGGNRPGQQCGVLNCRAQAHTKENIERQKLAMSEKGRTCLHVFLRGVKEKQVCGVRAKPGTDFCSKHQKKTPPQSPIITGKRPSPRARSVSTQSESLEKEIVSDTETAPEEVVQDEILSAIVEAVC